MIPEPGPSVTLNAPAVREETSEAEDSADGSLKEKLKVHKRFSAKDQQVAVYSGVGTLNLLALGAIGYWSYKRYTGGENGWKILGIAASAWVGLAAFEWLSIRYVSHIFVCFDPADFYSVFDTWKHKKEKTS